SWIRSFQASVDVFGIGSEDHFIAPGGFAHSLSLFALMQSLYLGATFHILTKFQPRKVKTLCNQYANSVLFLVPTMIDILLKEGGDKEVCIRFTDYLKRVTSVLLLLRKILIRNLVNTFSLACR